MSNKYKSGQYHILYFDKYGTKTGEWHTAECYTEAVEQGFRQVMECNITA